MPNPHAESLSAHCLGSASHPLADTTAWCFVVSLPLHSEQMFLAQWDKGRSGGMPQTYEVSLRLDMLFPGLILLGIAPSLLPVGRTILARRSSNISQCSDSCSQLGQGGQDTTPIPLASLGVHWSGRLAVRQHTGCKPEPGAPAVPPKLLACAQVRGKRCCALVWFARGAKHKAAGSRPSPGVLQSLQASVQRTAHVYTLWPAEGKGVMASASPGLVSDRLVLHLIFRLVIR